MLPLVGPEKGKMLLWREMKVRSSAVTPRTLFFFLKRIKRPASGTGYLVMLFMMLGLCKPHSRAKDKATMLVMGRQ